MSTKSPTVSVIVLATDNYKYLLATIASVRQQIFDDFEVLIFASSKLQNIVEWLELQSDSRLKLFYRRDIYTPRGFNWGIEEARGEYVTFLQAGDSWHPYKLQKQVRCLDFHSDAGLVHSWLMSIGNNDKTVGKILKYQLSGWVETQMLQRNPIAYQSVMIRRSCFDKVGIFDTRLQTTWDWDMWIRLSRQYRVLAIAQPLVYCRQDRRASQSWLNKETDLQATIEKAYQDAPDGLLTLKSRSYSYLSLSLAWQVLEDRCPDPVIAHHYCRQALEHSLHIGFEREFLQLGLAIFTFGCLKNDRYHRLTSLLQEVKTAIEIVSPKLKLSAYMLLHWMLESEEIAYSDRKTIKIEGLKNCTDS